MEETEKITIDTFNDFVEQLEKVKKECSEIVLSFYKYCHKHEPNSFKLYKDLMIDELKQYGLKPCKVTKDMNLIFKFKKIAEAIIYIKPYGVDLLVYKLWLRDRG